MFLGAQEYRAFKSIVTAQGHQFGHVFEVFEDAHGFIWFCTHDALIKHDGNDLWHYTYDDADTTTPTSDWNYAGMMDSQGRIWTGTARGLNRMDRATEKFTRYPHRPGDHTTIPHEEVRDIFEDKNGRIWISTFGGICYYNEETDDFSRLMMEGFAGERHSANFIASGNNGIWLTSTNGLYHLDIHSLAHRQVLPIESASIPQKAFFTRYAYADDLGRVWVSTRSGLWRYDPADQSYRQVDLGTELRDRPFLPLIEYPRGNLLIGSIHNGLIQMDLAKEKVVRKFTSSPLDHDGLLVNHIYSLFVDSKENLWVGLFRGAAKVNLGHRQLLLYKNTLVSNDLRNYTLSVYADPEGGIWSRSMQGAHYRESIHSPAQRIQDRDQLIDNLSGKTNFHLNAGTLWLSSVGKGLLKYHIVENKLTSIDLGLKPEDVESNWRFLFIPDKNQKDILWVACNYGLVRYEITTQQYQWYFPRDDIPELEENALGYIVQDNQNLWINCAHGLVNFNTNTQKFAFHALSMEGPWMRKNAVPILYQNDELWVAPGDYLCKWDPASHTFLRYDERKGLDREPITAMTMDLNGHLWLSRSDIARYDPVNEQTISYSFDHITEGLVIGGASTDIFGNIIFPSADGLVSLHPDSLTSTIYGPDVVITAIDLNGDPIQSDTTASFIGHIDISWQTKIIAIKYAALLFERTDEVQYRVKMDGFERDWRDVGATREATFTNLNPGKYTFHAAAQIADGPWTALPATLAITIAPPYWRTGWFYGGVVLLSMILLYLLMRYYLRLQKISGERDVAEQKARYKSLFLANMSHEIRTPMNAIVGMSKLIQDTELNATQREYAEIITESAESLLVIINDILDYSKIELGKYNIVNRPFQLTPLLRQLEMIFKLKSQEKKIEFLTEIDPTLPDFIEGDPHRIGQVLMNLLSNAIKFTEKGQVRLVAKGDPTGENIIFEVGDTGRGIRLEQQEIIFESFERLTSEKVEIDRGTGLGLSISRQLVQDQGGKLWLEKSVPGEGSTFRFILPLRPVDVAQVQSEPQSKILSQPGDFSFLVVEDTLFNQKLLVTLLEKYFPEAIVDVAQNGREALAKCSDSKYDLVFMDVKMPVMDGLAATRAIRRLTIDQNPEVPIIAVTANAIPDQLQQCREAGMNDFIIKPIDGTVLHKKICDILRLSTSTV